MSRQDKALLFIRLSLGCLLVCVGILVIGPFQGAEQAFGLDDKQAHFIAFFVLTLAVHLALPFNRRTDIALGLLALGALIEVVQMFTGRSASVGDWLADALGVGVATLPSFVETLRFYFRNIRNGTPFDFRRSSDRAKTVKLTPKL